MGQRELGKKAIYVVSHAPAGGAAGTVGGAASEKQALPPPASLAYDFGLEHRIQQRGQQQSAAEGAAATAGNAGLSEPRGSQQQQQQQPVQPAHSGLGRRRMSKEDVDGMSSDERLRAAIAASLEQ